MKPNMGTLDKTLRVLVAVVIIALYYFGIIQSGTLALVLLAFALIFVLTSLIGFCPLYLPLGISTKKKTE